MPAAHEPGIRIADLDEPAEITRELQWSDSTQGRAPTVSSTTNQTANRVLELLRPTTLSKVQTSAATTKPSSAPFNMRSTTTCGESCRGNSVMTHLPRCPVAAGAFPAPRHPGSRPL